MEIKSLTDNMNDRKLMVTNSQNHLYKFYLEAQEPNTKLLEDDLDDEYLNRMIYF